MTGFTLKFTPLSMMLFRWCGEYTWMVKGPSCEGVSEPFPLPTTIIGAVFAAMNTLLKRRTQKCDSLSIDEVEQKFVESLGSSASVRGPFVPGQRAVAVHLWPGKIIKITCQGDTVSLEVLKLKKRDEEYHIRYIGTALREDRRTVVRHLLYAESLLDVNSLGKLLRENGLDGSIAVDFINVDASSIAPSIGHIARLGAESRPVLLSREDTPLLYNFVKDLVSKLDCPDSYFVYVVSPILISPCEDLIKSLSRGERINLSEFMEEDFEKDVEISVPRIRELENLFKDEKDITRLAKQVRVNIAMLSPGFDTVRVCPRPALVAIMPGSILKLEGVNKKAILEVWKRGLGLYSRLGWGTFIPLPEGRVKAHL